MVNETFKKFGYLNLIPTDFTGSNEFLIRDIYIKKNFFQLFDSLELTYVLDTIENKYYREFWQRRKLEHNDSIVFEIVKEINLIKNQKVTSYNSSYVNDTLYNLLSIQFRPDTLTKKLALQHFTTLKKFEMHQSAFNLLFERADYFKINWNKDSLVATLDTASNYPGAWFEDDTK